MLGYVRKIIPQSTVDGPGNRTAIFLQGCNIRCAYCHNPETWERTSNNEVRQMSATEVAEEVKKGIPFIRGITVSGGECMLQAEFVEELFELIKPLGLSCLIDSNGTIPFQLYPRLLELTDGVMLDVKAWDSSVYKRLTGADNDNIVKDNLRLLSKLGKLTEVRIVCLPSFSNSSIPHSKLVSESQIPQRDSDLRRKEDTPQRDSDLRRKEDTLQRDSDLRRNEDTLQRDSDLRRNEDTPYSARPHDAKQLVSESNSNFPSQQFSVSTDVENILTNVAQVLNARVLTSDRAALQTAIPVRLLRFRPQGVIGALSKYPMPDDEQMQRYFLFATASGLNVSIT
ncbi:MAG: radical SAM protein [Paludibacteraceae bacterium]|nr:radical SAM protein [Paludibacteraceae bacterium]